jgi:hypothetical protein
MIKVLLLIKQFPVGKLADLGNNWYMFPLAHVLTSTTNAWLRLATLVH